METLGLFVLKTAAIMEVFSMKNWALFRWAVKHLKIKNGDYQHCLRNIILIFFMKLSGVKPSDVKAIWYTKDNIFYDLDLA